MIECKFRIDSIRNSRVGGFLVAIEGKKIDIMVNKIHFLIDDSIYNQLLTHYGRIVSIEVDKGIIMSVAELPEGEKPIYTEIMAKHYGKIILDIFRKEDVKIMKKSELIDAYMEETKKSERTARNRMKQALEFGLLKEKDYYHIELIGGIDK